MKIRPHKFIRVCLIVVIRSDPVSFLFSFAGAWRKHTCLSKCSKVFKVFKVLKIWKNVQLWIGGWEYQTVSGGSRYDTDKRCDVPRHFRWKAKRTRKRYKQCWHSGPEGTLFVSLLYTVKMNNLIISLLKPTTCKHWVLKYVAFYVIFQNYCLVSINLLILNDFY